MKFDLILYFASPYEALAGKANGLQDLAVEYPTRSVWDSLSRSLEQLGATDENSILGIFLLRAAQNTQRRLDQCQTASYVVAYRPLLRVERALAETLTIPKSPRNELEHFVNFPAPPAGERVTDFSRAAVLSWQRSTVMMANLTNAMGGEFMGILMPTPWIHPSGLLPPHSTPDQVAYYSKKFRRSPKKCDERALTCEQGAWIWSMHRTFLMTFRWRQSTGIKVIISTKWGLTS
jgi:hypothetical protein